MRKQFQSLVFLLAFFTLGILQPAFADGPAPPPPGHSLNGNQASPGGTGCPIDRKDGIIVVLLITLGYAGFILYRRGKPGNDTTN
jgi:hypothetical protein